MWDTLPVIPALAPIGPKAAAKTAFVSAVAVNATAGTQAPPSKVAALPPAEVGAAAAPLTRCVAPLPAPQGGEAAAALAPIGPKAAAKAAKAAVRSAALAQAVLYGNVLVERGLKRMWTDDNWLHVWVCARCGLGEAACGLNPKPGVADQCIAAGPRTKKPKRGDHFISW